MNRGLRATLLTVTLAGAVAAPASLFCQVLPVPEAVSPGWLATPPFVPAPVAGTRGAVVRFEQGRTWLHVSIAGAQADEAARIARQEGLAYLPHERALRVQLTQFEALLRRHGITDVIEVGPLAAVPSK
ncbi:hypothetical protein [Ramlibacter alkalitolerans]|uniref:Uncharacterized protein n=1 Tax=Ramlibacter alkalitolerans TaxID=2039631 RepID=A0ABS1JUP6_9BURK|nr:hypothetical protein [Ramlibacter alkalitolerans]MBL0427881.1 hypothetical protein [Ramlibacter alkalitolerans]